MEQREPSAAKLREHRKPVNKRSLRKGGQNRGQRSGEREIRESKGTDVWKGPSLGPAPCTLTGDVRLLQPQSLALMDAEDQTAGAKFSKPGFSNM